MKKQINTLMKQNNIDALVFIGVPALSKDWFYVAGPVKIGHGFLIWKKGNKPVLFCGDMERTEAQKTGFKIVCFSELKLPSKIKIKDRMDMNVAYLESMLKMCNIKGNISIHGVENISVSYPLLKRLEKRFSKMRPSIKLIEHDNVLTQARYFKDHDEIKCIKENGKVCSKIFSELRAYLSTMYQKDSFVTDKNGRKVKIGEIKDWIRDKAAEYKLILREEFIFSQGKDAGVPHALGKDHEPLKIGKTIVFDFFPPSSKTGYYFDMTRTFCLGSADESTMKLYQDVLKAQKIALKNIKTGISFSKLDQLVCDAFESGGHETLRKNGFIQSGYIHSLGHGIGLDCHETPTISFKDNNSYKIKKGMVFTIEPGLYYPNKGMGVRIEDMIIIHPDGKIENASRSVSKEFIIKLRKF